MAFSSAETLLGDLPMFSMKPGLERITALLEKFGRPDKGLRFLHVAGTNGKGSVGAMLERGLREAGLRTAFYSSPHLVEVRERFRLNGRAVSEEKLTEVLEKVLPEARPLQASYFEVTTAAAILLFAEAHADAVVWETGLGGRLDATNAVQSAASIITNIALDHQRVLGGTLSAIAREKAGILKRGVPLFLGIVPPEAEKVILARAAELGAPVFRPVEEPEEVTLTALPDGRPAQRLNWRSRVLELSLPGAMQVRNARLAVQVLTHFAAPWNFDLARALTGFRKVYWPARCQKVDERLWVDGAHNPDGLRALAEVLTALFPGKKLPVVFGAFADKAVAEGVSLLAPHVGKWYFTPLGAPGRTSVDPAKLAAMAEECAPGVPAERFPDAASAMRRALAENREGALPVLSAGSLFLAGQILRDFAPRGAAIDLEVPDFEVKK